MARIPGQINTNQQGIDLVCIWLLYHISFTKKCFNFPLGRVGSAFTATSDMENGKGPDHVSVLSAGSGRSRTTSQLEAATKLPWYGKLI